MTPWLLVTFLLSILGILWVRNQLLLWLEARRVRYIEKEAAKQGLERLRGETTDELRDRLFQKLNSKTWDYLREVSAQLPLRPTLTKEEADLVTEALVIHFGEKGDPRAIDLTAKFATTSNEPSVLLCGACSDDRHADCSGWCRCSCAA